MKALRPQSFADFNGQESALAQLRVAVTAAQRMKKMLGHILLTGPRGLGKTTLGHHVIPAEMEGSSRYVNCTAVEKPQDLSPLLTTMQPGEQLFLDEIHALPKVVLEMLYSVMEDSKLTVMIGDEKNRKPVTIELEPFTIIGATTREGLLPDPLRDRFKHSVRLDLYSDDEMRQVLNWTADKLDVVLHENSADLLVPICHGTARHAVNLIESCIDSLYGSIGVMFPDGTVIRSINDRVVRETLKRLGFSINGLSRVERELLRKLAGAPGKTMGLKTIAAVLDEEDDTVEQVYEPWLLRTGLIAKTASGRTVTPAGEAALREAGG